MLRVYWDKNPLSGVELFDQKESYAWLEGTREINRTSDLVHDTFTKSCFIKLNARPNAKILLKRKKNRMFAFVLCHVNKKFLANNVQKLIEFSKLLKKYKQRIVSAIKKSLSRCKVNSIEWGRFFLLNLARYAHIHASNWYADCFLARFFNLKKKTYNAGILVTTQSFSFSFWNYLSKCKLVEMH